MRGTDLDSRQGYRALLKQLAAAEHELPLRSMVNRLLARARLSKKPGEHMGMSVPLYTNCTSPLRKYLDFLVHLQLKATSICAVAKKRSTSISGAQPCTAGRAPFGSSMPVAVTLAGEDSGTPHLALFKLSKDSSLKASAATCAAGVPRV